MNSTTGTSYHSAYEQSLRFTRTSDQKVFTVVTYGHWSQIVADDQETDTIKWFNADEYVSALKGHSYLKTRVQGVVDTTGVERPDEHY